MKNHIIALAVMLSALTALCQIGRVSNITCDIARNSTYSCRFTAMTDAAVMANILYNSSEFDVSGWTGIFFIGDGHGGMAITNTASEFSSFLFSIPVSSIPTNGTYYSQLIGYKNGRIEEWGRGIVVVDGNYSDGTLPAEWIREHPIYQIAMQALDVANNAYQLVAGQSNVFWAIISSIPNISSNDMARWNQAHEATTNIPSLAKGMTNLVSQSLNDAKDYADNSVSGYKVKRLYNPTNSLEWTEIRGREKLTYTVSASKDYYAFASYSGTTNMAAMPYPLPLDNSVYSFGNIQIYTTYDNSNISNSVIFTIYDMNIPEYISSSKRVFFPSPETIEIVNANNEYVGTLFSYETYITNVTSEVMAFQSDLGLFRDVATNVIWRKVVSNGWEYLIAHTNYTVGGAQ